MYRGLKVVAIAPVLDEERKIGEVVRRMPRDVVDTVLVVDDGSTDRSAEVARSEGAEVLDLGATLGVGAAIRAGLRYAVENDFDVAVVIAGNNKDSPEQITRLIHPIADDAADIVQGSRYLNPTGSFGEMPRYRRLATRVHPLLFSWFSGRKITDSTNGYRAIRLAILATPGLDLDQAWLDEYELEPYLLFKSIKLGLRVREAPVDKVYPPKELGQTKMRPVVDWWSILRPIFLLGLRLKR